MTFTLHQGDAFQVMATLPAASVDLVVTSPPYNVGIDYGPLVNDRLPWPEYYSWLTSLLASCLRLLRAGGVLALNVPKDVRLTTAEIEQTGRRVEKVSVQAEVLAERVGFLPREAIVWVKGREETGPIATTGIAGADNNIYLRPTCEMILLFSKDRYYYDNGTGRRGKQDVPFTEETKDVWWNVPARRTNHPAPFPVEIPDRLIRMFTVWRPDRPAPVVLDPFMGCGTTGVAALKLQRAFIGIEINPQFFQRANTELTAIDSQLPLLSHDTLNSLHHAS